MHNQSLFFFVIVVVAIGLFNIDDDDVLGIDNNNVSGQAIYFEL